MKSTKRNTPRRGWTLRGIAGEVLTVGNLLSLFVLCLVISAVLFNATAVSAARNTRYVISAAPTSFTFAATVNAPAPAQQTVIFIATPSTPLPFAMSANEPWITMSTTSGVTKSTIQLGVNPAGLAAGSYSGQILVSPTGAGDPSMTIPVSLTVSPAPVVAPYVISAAPTAFSFSAIANGTTPALQTVIFIATPSTPLPFTMAANQPWITMSATSGVTKSTIQLGVNLTGLAAGSYSGQIVVTPTGAGNPPMTIPLSLTVTAATPGTLTSSIATLSFSNVNIGTSNSLQTVLTNSGNSSVDISNVSISGAGFTATGVPAGTILTAGQTATLNVAFDPSATGSVTGTVIISSNASNPSDSIVLSGTGVQPVSHSVSLTWAETTGSISGYNTYQSTVSGGSYTKLNSSLDTAETYTDSTVQAGLTYYYVVTAVDAAGVESAYSNQVTVVVP